METVTISLNGREVAGPAGITILDLARQVGVEIPTLCHHPLLKNAGACRVCLVEDARTGRLLASCVTPIAKGMEILTDSAAAAGARRGVLELILSDHPSACVICSKGNECILRSLAKDHGICDPELEAIRRWMPVQEVNPFIVRDLTKCVLCGRCIRVCKDFEAVGAIEYMGRGYNSHPGTASRTPLEGSECNFCGSCVALCPTDALAERERFSISSGTGTAVGVCSYCGTGCSLEYQLSNGVVAGARGISGNPINSLSLCVRGRYGQDALSSTARLKDPLIRKGDGTMGPSSWEEALGLVADRLGEIVEQYGSSSIGVIAGTQCSNEEFYLAGRFARSGIGTPHIDSAARFSSGVVVEGLSEQTMSIRPGGSLESILEAQTVFLVGARPDYTHPVVARNVRRAVRNRGAALVQLDPLVTSLTPFARIHFRDDIDEQHNILGQIMHDLVACNLHDTDFVQAKTTNLEEFVAGLNLHPKSQIQCKETKEAAKLLDSGRRVVFLVGSMASRNLNGYGLIQQLVNLSFLCGQPQSVFFLFDGCNELGAWEMGCTPDWLPGYAPLEDPDARESVRRTWKTNVAFQRGLNSMEMVRAAEAGNLRALFFLGADPLTVFPDSARTQKALSKMDLVVRTGLFLTQTSELAEFVFPSTAITEADGTYINTEGRVQRIAKITDPPGNARPSARFIIDLAGRIGPPMGFLTARDIFEEIRTICPPWQSLIWSDVGRPGGVSHASAGQKYLATGIQPDECLLSFSMSENSFVPPGQTPPERPWRVFPEERAVHPGDGVISSRSARLSRFWMYDTVRMTPEDAGSIKAEDGAWVLVRSDVGEVRVKLAIDPRVPRSGIIIPFGGPRYIYQKLVSWPEEGHFSGLGTTFVSVAVEE